VLLSHGPNKAFLVPDACRVTERNGNSISTDIIDDACFRYFQTFWQLLWTFWYCRINKIYMYIIIKHQIHLHSLRNRLAKLAKGSPFYLFLKLVQINFILYIYLKERSNRIRIFYSRVWVSDWGIFQSTFFQGQSQKH
jgi:Ni,Fe-hydrogenase I cytochrome b subunit